MPYGFGGGGVLPYLDIRHPNVLTGSSLAKAFGVPVAVLSGASKWLQRIRDSSLMRIHCSPPSIANLYAANQALRLNQREGDERRKQVLLRVRQFQTAIAAAGLASNRYPFPIQNLKLGGSSRAPRVYRQLKQAGIQTVLTTSHQNQPVLTVLFRADQRKEAIKTLTDTLRFATGRAVQRQHIFQG
jgi:8-amino-7-oxononanoate synthase